MGAHACRGCGPGGPRAREACTYGRAHSRGQASNIYANKTISCSLAFGIHMCSRACALAFAHRLGSLSPGLALLTQSDGCKHGYTQSIGLSWMYRMVGWTAASSLCP